MNKMNQKINEWKRGKCFNASDIVLNKDLVLFVIKLSIERTFI